MISPAFPLTVPRHLWDAMADEASPEFADSYLAGAELSPDDKLTPHTQVGWSKIKASDDAMRCLSGLNIKLVKPGAFGSKDNHVSLRDLMPEVFPDAIRRRRAA